MTHTRPKHPNVVIVVLDSVRRDHLSCYGYRRPTTPILDRLVDESVLYTRASAASCWTLPSHASLFTGLFPSEHRADLDTKRLVPEHQTLAAYLGRLGYQSASISCNGFVSEQTGLTRGFDASVDVERRAGGPKGFVPRVVRGLHRRWRNLTSRDRGARRATGRAARWLSQRDPDRPFLLFLNYMECHLPYRLVAEDRHLFLDPAEAPDAEAVPQDPFGVMAGAVSLSPRQLELLQALYDGCLHFLDRQVGVIIHHLRRLGIEDRTLLLVTSDHGESFGEHGLMDHQYGLYENLLAVPLIVRFPGRARWGESDPRLVSLVDVLPTVAALAGDGAGEPLPVPGESFLDGPPRDAVAAEYLVPNLRPFQRRFPSADTRRFDVPIRSVRDEQHKLIWYRDDRTELYDLDADPGETRNLAATRPDLVAELKEKLEAELGSWPSRAEGPPADEGWELVRDRLEQLGYL